MEFGGAAAWGSKKARPAGAVEARKTGMAKKAVAADKVRNHGGRGKLSKKAVFRMNSDIPVSFFLEFRLAFVPECRFLN